MTTIAYTNADALRIALLASGLAENETRCVSNRLEDGFFRIDVRTPYQAYEFYVDGESGEVAGMNAEPMTLS